MVGIFQWWYGSGWLRHLKRSYVGILRTADFFSLGLLARTLFNPFRQISATGGEGSLPVKLSSFFDRLLSRSIGAFVRSMTMLIGLIAILARVFWTAISIIVWTLLPLTPVVGFVMWLAGGA